MALADFEALHGGRNDAWAMLLAFDILELDGKDLRGQPLLERKRRLHRVLRSAKGDGLQFVEHVEGDASKIFEQVCRLGLEGIVCKRADSIYRAGRSRAWLKIKNPQHASIARIRDAIEAGTFGAVSVNGTPHPARMVDSFCFRCSPKESRTQSRLQPAMRN
jgi:ATP-dependent DNA ligase